ncbi:MAG TPA: cation:proton antiporter, partial [Pirellulales bacterium]|nr:cation:proton antiporter [Pirellulales bacterium]
AQSSVMLWLGYVCARLFGWTVLECLYAGAIVAIPSTTIVVKSFAELRVTGKLVDLVVGILLVEDLIAIFLLAILTTLSSGESLSAPAIAMTAGRLAAFLIGLLVVGMLIVPRLMRAVMRLNRPETTVVASVGISFAFALLAIQFGYSVALGAFIAGTLVAESGHPRIVEHAIHGVRDLFAAIFFVAVGMLIDPTLVAENWLGVVVFTLLVIIGEVLAVSTAAFLTGYPIRTSVKAGMSLAQIGEFSFIIAGVGVAAGVVGDYLYPIAVAVSAITTLTTPLLIRSSDKVASFIDRKLPRSLQTFGALYASWIEQMRLAPDDRSKAAELRRWIRMLLVDFVLVSAIVIGVSVQAARLTTFISDRLGLDRRASVLVLLLSAAALAAPFCIGIIRNARGLGQALAVRVLPTGDAGTLDLGLAPRRALIVTLQLAIVLLLGAPLVAITQPFVPPFQGAAILAVVLLLLGLNFWRSATELQGHARAGAQTLVEILAVQARGTSEPAADAMLQVHDILPGLGDPEPIVISDTSPAVGRTLGELNLRSLTGATILAITRSNERLVVPSGSERLASGDVLAVAGSHDAIAAARAMLGGTT